MAVPFAEALARLRAPECGTCRYEFGPASFTEEGEYDRLVDWYAEAVAALTAEGGPPLEPTPAFVGGIDVERAACWRRPGAIAYVLLSWGDNTRYRLLTLGLARRGTVVAGCWTAPPG